MSVTRLFDEDPLVGIRRTWHEDHEGAITVATEHVVEPIIEHTKAAFNSTDERAPWKGDLVRVASIPLSIYFDLERRGITKDPKAFKRWLEDPNNRAFRTRPGRI